ncbi:LURP-one-related family protein [Clostridium swellfunianum]|uniref:LURP-one-related/scramblase family protein n=1 Tax=Clostridium swellfunianum TaxID=1367462 RepID=UPI00202F72DD|nr:LURP-one-related family protein [Clostridium swellfunianum]MCM0648299.1 LURP-one-related family protein [Clostridium swellfunianum]
MRYKIRQRIFSFGDNFTIRDEEDNARFEVRGKVFSFGDKLKIHDILGNELVYIEQEMFHLMPRFNIYLDGNYAASVKKEFSLFRPSFTIESSMGNYTIEGDIFSHEFEILNNGRQVAYVSKGWFTLSDVYGADIADSENQAFMLAMVIVIDQILYDKKK